VLEKRVDVYSILIDNPFVAAGATGGNNEGSDEAVPRIIRNQILIRGAPVVGRALTVAGTTAMAAGISMASKPVKPKQFLHISRRDRIAKLKYRHGGNWKSAWRAERKKFVHYDPRSGKDVTAQQIRAQQRAQRNVRAKSTMLKGAGGTMIAAGRLVPTVAAGMVVGSYLKTEDGRPTTQIDILAGDVRPDTGGLAQDVAKLHALTMANVEQAFMLGSTAYYLGKAAKERIL
jgi:hypothetical protein